MLLIETDSVMENTLRTGSGTPCGAAAGVRSEIVFMIVRPTPGMLELPQSEM